MHLTVLGYLDNTPLRWLKTFFLDLPTSLDTTNFPLRHFASDLPAFKRLCELTASLPNKPMPTTPTNIQPFLNYLYTFPLFTKRPQIYACVSLTSNSFYIGQTYRGLMTRFLEHCQSSNRFRKGLTHSTLPFHRYLSKRLSDFVIVPLCYTLETSLSRLESYLINGLSPSLNDGDPALRFSAIPDSRPNTTSKRKRSWNHAFGKLTSKSRQHKWTKHRLSAEALEAASTTVPHFPNPDLTINPLAYQFPTPSCQLPSTSDLPTFRLTDPPNLRPSDLPTFRPSDLPIFQPHMTTLLNLTSSTLVPYTANVGRNTSQIQILTPMQTMNSDPGSVPLNLTQTQTLTQRSDSPSQVRLTQPPAGHLLRTSTSSLLRGTPLYFDIEGNEYTNDLSSLLRFRLYDNLNKDKMTILFHNPSGLPLLKPQHDHIFLIFASSPVQIISPAHLSNTIYPLHLLTSILKTLHFGIFLIHSLQHNFDRLLTFKDILLQAARPRRADLLHHLSKSEILTAYDSLPTIERPSTRKKAKDSLLFLLAKAYNQPKFPHLHFSYPHSPYLSTNKVRFFISSWIHSLPMDPPLKDIFCKEITISEKSNSSVTNLICNHLSASRKFRPAATPSCSCQTLLKLSLNSPHLLRNASGHLTIKANHLPPLFFSPIQNNAKESTVSDIATAAISLKNNLDAFFPRLYAFRNTSNTQSPYVELLDSEKMIVCKSPTGSPLGKLRKPIFNQLHSRFHNARPLHNPLSVTYLHCLASLLLRYNTDRNVRISWTLNDELQLILFTSMACPTLRFSSPLDVHSAAQVYFTLHPEDKVFGAS